MGCHKCLCHIATAALETTRRKVGNGRASCVAWKQFIFHKIMDIETIVHGISLNIVFRLLH